jgi:hypothetical protein
MFIAYVVVTLLAAAANIFSATLDFIRYKQVLINMAKAGVSESWITPLGILKAAGAIGLLVGIGVPLIGTGAAIGLILFFVGAIIIHLRARDHSFGLAVVFLFSAGRGRAGVETGRLVSSEAPDRGTAILALGRLAD